MPPKSKSIALFVINGLTLSRIVLAVSIPYFDSYLILTAISLYGAVTDYLDGLLARIYDQQTDFGARLDQYADKIFQSIALITLHLSGKIGLIFLCLFFLRETVMIVLRWLGRSSSTSNLLGKLKTTVLYVLITYVYAVNADLSPAFYYDAFVLFLEVVALVTAYASLGQSLRQRHIET